MAAGLLQAALPHISIASAGLGALVGMPADPMAVRILLERDIDISGHRAVQINKKMCIDADLIFAMDQDQRTRIDNMYPQVRGRVFRVAEHRNLDVPDPYRRPEAAFRQALNVIEMGTQEWLRRIERL